MQKLTTCLYKLSGDLPKRNKTSCLFFCADPQTSRIDKTVCMDVLIVFYTFIVFNNFSATVLIFSVIYVEKS